MISVILPVRNGASWIQEAVGSILSQTLLPDEILVGDDASTDGTADLVEAMGSPLVKILRAQERKGISRQCNEMIALATGRYIARMDGDDISHPFRFQRLMEALEKRSLGVVGSWSRRFGASRTEHRFAVEDADLKAGLLFSVPFCHPSVVIDRRRVGAFQYDPDFDGAEDYNLWIRLRGRVPYGNVPDFLLDWRMHDRNVGTVSETAELQRSLASKTRDMLLAAYGVALPLRERAALEARARSATLDLEGSRAFLGALLSLRKVPEDRLLAPRSALLRAIAAQWDLSCLFSAWSTPGIAHLWWQGNRKLEVAPSPRTAVKLLLKSFSRIARHT